MRGRMYSTQKEQAEKTKSMYRLHGFGDKYDLKTGFGFYKLLCPVDSTDFIAKTHVIGTSPVNVSKKEFDKFKPGVRFIRYGFTYYGHNVYCFVAVYENKISEPSKWTCMLYKGTDWFNHIKFREYVIEGEDGFAYTGKYASAFDINGVDGDLGNKIISNAIRKGGIRHAHNLYTLR